MLLHFLTHLPLQSMLASVCFGESCDHVNGCTLYCRCDLVQLYPPGDASVSICAGCLLVDSSIAGRLQLSPSLLGCVISEHAKQVCPNDE